MNPWQPFTTAPKDRWIWCYSRTSRTQMSTPFRWDASREMWYAGLGWYHSIDNFFTHWADITSGTPPEKPE